MRISVSDLIVFAGNDIKEMFIDVPTHTLRKTAVRRDLKSALHVLDHVIEDVDHIGFDPNDTNKEIRKIEKVNSDIINIMSLLQGVNSIINDDTEINTLGELYEDHIEPRVDIDHIKMSVDAINENISHINRIFDQTYSLLKHNMIESTVITKLNDIEDMVRKINLNVDLLQSLMAPKMGPKGDHGK